MKTDYPDVPLLGDLNFEVSIYDRKYAYRFYTDGKSELIRKGVLWEERNPLGDGLILAMAQELYELKKVSPPELPRAVAQRALDEAKIGKAPDGVALLSVPAPHVLDIAARAVTMDRDRGRVDFGAVADKILDADVDDAEIVSERQCHEARLLIISALNYAQASGARFVPRPTVGEDDYAEAVAAACEAFATTLKSKGLMA